MNQEQDETSKNNHIENKKSLQIISCDRRTSRAAREIVRQFLLHDLKTNNKHKKIINNGSNSDIESFSVWSLIETFYSHMPTSCPLHPSRDVLRQDEEEGTKLIRFHPLQHAYPIYALKRRRKNGDVPHDNNWYQCGYCSKVFATRYYLDLHLKTHHSSSSSSMLDDDNEKNNNSTTTKQQESLLFVCPAVEYCQLLFGRRQCAEMALLLEPYYDVGSNGWDSQTSNTIHHLLTKRTHDIPYNATNSIMDACQEIWIDQCQLPPETCQVPYYKQQHATLFLYHKREFFHFDSTTWWHPNWFGAIILILLGWFYFLQLLNYCQNLYFQWQRNRQHGNKNKNNGKRLLQQKKVKKKTLLFKTTKTTRQKSKQS